MKLFFICIFIMLLTLTLALSWPESEKVFVYKTVENKKKQTLNPEIIKLKSSINELEKIPPEYMEQIIDVFSPEIRQSK